MPARSSMAVRNAARPVSWSRSVVRARWARGWSTTVVSTRPSCADPSPVRWHPWHDGPMERAELARMIDHTLLAPAATPGQVALLCTEAIELGVAAVCVSPSRLPLPEPELPDAIATCTVVGFPSGAHHASVKAAEAQRA